MNEFVGEDIEFGTKDKKMILRPQLRFLLSIWKLLLCILIIL